uniref:ER lumen protein-retaining receptor n=1 Tax=Chromera velia CCMP2878 TaxID=1169474 RepID=A0A0G4I464_9ALVE|eukprot:Cvel_10797.t1-p1 / transcript=Cvel_10797.t1 / gene=Cvel_10797 / organism=Chromera_velia_CCMP2878 / gene_product=ER lumen protein retaining receptor, putative / transcript_product=ER lumen protein retaining receptor, putative / location=Cvel_scaffold660:42128-45652(+) / protein_length=208 / sequence_SO=supercontig / SO=protein_coding / is_pseudo=false
MIHLASIFILLFKLTKSKNCVGISCRMQEMYAIVFCLRYVDLLYQFVSVYNSAMKVIFLISTFYLIYLMRYKAPICQTYDANADNFPYEKFLLPPAAILGFLTAELWTIPEIMWSTSIWLEAVTIVPQLMLLQAQREIENLTSDYVFAMGTYRALYIVNWVFRYFMEGYVNWVGWVGGIIQTGLYVDFFYYYAMSKWYGQKLVLPIAA